jgi:hypothetical protein
MLTLLQGGVCLFSFFAAIFWLRSATIRLPNIMENITWAGTGAFPDALQAQARWNAYGASAASIAALLQATTFIWPLILPN